MTAGGHSCGLRVLYKYRYIISARVIHSQVIAGVMCLQVFLFYGTDTELHDLPLPRLPHHQWALMHEESPKNNWAFSSERMMSLFNYTATFKRESDYPLTLQWLTSIEVGTIIRYG